MSKEVEWLMDIDGVINSLGRPGWPEERTFHVGGDGQKYPFRVGVGLLEGIADIQADFPSLRILLASTWNIDAGDLKRRLGVDWDLAFELFDYSATWALKLDAVSHRLHVSKTPTIWTDDEARQISGFNTDINSSRFLMLEPISWTGLVPAHLDLVREFLSAL